MANDLNPLKKDRFGYLRYILSSIGVRATLLALQSANFVESVVGWRLNANGLIEGTRLRLDNFIARDDSSISYVGTWADENVNTFYGQGSHYSSTVGDTFTIQFTGASIGVVAEKSNAAGKIDFSLDGGATETIDLYSTTSFTRSVIYSKTGLSNKPHTLVGTIATKNASSSSNKIRIQGYVKSPTDGIKVDAISADVITISLSMQTDANGYATSAAPSVPSGYSSWCITGAQLTTSVMDDATTPDPKISTILNTIYLYGGGDTITYAVLVEFLVSKT